MTTLKYKQENAKSYDDRPISFTKEVCIEEERKLTTSTVIQFPLISDAIQMVWPFNWRRIHLEE